VRFMMLMIPKGYAEASPDVRPDAKAVEAMMKFNEELAKAGALIALDGLHPPAVATRVAFPGGKPKVIHGPFSEVKEVVGGYWMIDVKSKQDAVDWATRCPAAPGDVVEIRQVFEMSDFPADVQKAADSPTVRAEVERHRRAKG